MRKILIGSVALLSLLLVGRFSPADEPKKDDAMTYTGYVVDNMCAADMVKAQDPQAAAAKHPKACAVKCADSGYGIMSGGKFLKFDAAGNKLAKDYLAKDDSTTQAQVVGVKQDDGSLAVKSLSAPMPTK